MHHRTKLEFLRYIGDDPTKWLNHVSHYFTSYKVVEEEMGSLATFDMESKA